MIENGQHNELPRIVSVPLRWALGRWNEALYGFSEGKPVRDRVETLMSQQRLRIAEMEELLDLGGKTHNRTLQLRMEAKILAGVRYQHLLEHILPEPESMQAIRYYLSRDPIGGQNG